jgi:hypothetical protein
MSRQDIFEVIVVGGGSAGVAAARCGARTALVRGSLIFGPTRGCLMTKVRKLLFAAVACVVPVVAFVASAQGAAGSTTKVAIPAQYFGTPNPVPGGLTLVPGTVVVPGVGGSAVTGTVPVPGTPGAPGVSNFDPAFNTAPYPGIPGNGSALYPPTYYPQFGLPVTNQSTMPQAGSAAPGIPGIGLNGFSNIYPNGAPPPGGLNLWGDRQ